MVEPFEDQPGILSVLSGYTGGTVPNPTYDQVLSGTTGHVEAVEIIFDPKIITYQDLLQLYWQVTDPTDAFGQFQDRGNFYRPIIFYTTAEQEVLAQRAKKELAQSGYYQQPIVTEIRMAAPFWPAENYHQAFYKKQPKRYQRIKRARKQLMLFYKLKRWTNRGEKRS
jgi:peptide-methionine (S)-S-oxide reductase